MLVSTLITRIREDYLDDTLGVSDDDSLVKESSLIRFADEAQKQACRRMNLIYDETTSGICSFALVAGQSNYSLSDSVTRLERVSHNSIDLDHTTEDALDLDYTGWRTTDDATPTQYYLRGNTLYINPAPDADAIADDAALSLAVYRLPTTEITEKSQSFEIIEEATDDLIYWMLYRVYNLRDEDLFDPNNAALYLSMFNNSYGEPVPLDVRIHQFENPQKSQHRPSDSYTHTGDANIDPDFDSTGWS